MKNCEQLYSLYKNEPKLSNPEVMGKLKWTSHQVRKYKYLLKKRGFIGVDKSTDGEEIIILKDYSGTELESDNFKQEAYKQLYDSCINKMEDANLSISQFIQLEQEARLILNKIV